MTKIRHGEHYSPLSISVDKGATISAVHDALDVYMLPVAFMFFFSLVTGDNVECCITGHNLGQMALLGTPARTWMDATSSMMSSKPCACCNAVRSMLFFSYSMSRVGTQMDVG